MSSTETSSPARASLGASIRAALRGAALRRVIPWLPLLVSPVVVAQAPATETPEDTEVVVVQGIREGLAKSLDLQKQSRNLKVVLTADDIGTLPDKNVADALSRLSGVGVVSNDGEGRFVTIRGVDPGLNNVTLNGESLAASDSAGRSGRAAPLDILGSASLRSIEVIKTVTPDLDGQSIGGTINVLTPSAFDWEERAIFGTAEGVFNDLSSHGDNYALSLNYADRFGAQENWGLFLAVNDSSREYVTNNIQARYLETPTGGLAPDRIRLPGSVGKIDRLGVTANLEFRQANDARYYLRAYYTEDDNKYVESENRIDFTGPFVSTDELSGTATGAWANNTTYDLVEREVSQYVAGAEIPIGSSFQLSFSGAYTEGVESLPLHEIYDFRSHNNTRAAAYDLSTPYFPEFQLAGFGVNEFPDTPTLWELNRIREESSLVEEKTYTGRIDLSWQNEIGGTPVKLRFGAKAIDRKKGVNDESYRYASRPRPRINYASTPTGAGGPLGVDHSSYLNFGDYLDGRYSYGPTPDVNAVRGYYHATKPAFPGYVAHRNADWDFLLEPSYSGSSEDDYQLREKILAGYLRTDVEVSDRLTVLGGVRVERTDGEISSVTLATTGGVGQLEPVEGGSEYTSVLPNLQFHYRASEKAHLRGAVTWTISRPDYVHLSPNSTLSYDDPDENGQYEGSLSIGNPELDPYEATNYDLSFDYYFAPESVISLGVFYKDIQNAIYNYSDVLRNVEFGGRQYEELQRDTVLNAGPGHIQGAEFTWQQAFTFLPAPFDGFGAVANYVYTDSAVRPFDRDEDVTFFGQADDIGNLQLYYEKFGLEARIAYHWQGAALDSLGASTTFDNYIAERETLDFKASYRFDQWKVYGEIRNLTDEPARAYTGSAGLLAFDGAANQYTGRFYTLGIGWSY